MLSRRAFFRLAVVAPPAVALALAAPVTAAPVAVAAVDSIDTFRLSTFAMTLLGLLAPGEAISMTDYNFVRLFAVKGMSPEDLALRIRPYYIPVKTVTLAWTSDDFIDLSS